MKVGLLECDHVPDRLRSIDGDYRDMFQNLFPDLDFEFYDLVNGDFPASVQDCDAYMVTGSHNSVYDNIDWVHRLKDLVRDIYLHQKGYIGICYGHQMLAEALGGKVQKNQNGWCVGAHTFEIIKHEPWMVPDNQQINVLMLCQDQVVQLPEHSVVLAKSKDCPIAMFKVGERMLGIQGHPEFSKEYDRALIEERVERIGAQKAGAGIKSITAEINADMLAQWITHFLTSQ